MTNEVAVRYPWEAPAVQPVEEIVTLLQRDFAYAVVNTALRVHSNNMAFHMTVNSPRGQLIPRGEVKFMNGTTVEIQDIGMCQPGIDYATVQQVMARILEIAGELGLELAK